MTKFGLFVFCLITISFTGMAQKVFRTAPNTAFGRGEKLGYRIHYGFIEAVTSTIEVTRNEKKFGGRPTLHVVGNAKSRGTFDFFFRVRDRYESYIDEESLMPWLFIRRVDEGGYKINQDYVFNHHANKVVDREKTFTIWDYTQDMISSFFYVRTLDLGSHPIGHIFSVPTIVDGDMYNLQIKFLGRETVKTDFGKIRCLKFVPILQVGRIFKKEEDLVMWLSDDKNHIPIRAKADILFGSLKVDLTSYSGLMNPITFTK
jgi:hypothetical protein